MFPSHTDPVFIVAVCGGVWLAIWWSARDKEIRAWTVIISCALILLGGCGALTWYATRISSETWCAQGIQPCQRAPVEWRSWMSLVISLAIVGFLTFKMNTPSRRKWTQAVLENRKQVTSVQYCVALILRMQLIMIGFIGMAVLFWSSDPKSGASLLVISLLFLALYASSLIPVMSLILRIDQLEKYKKSLGLAYAAAPVVCAFVILPNQRVKYLLDALQIPGGDSRYLALVILFGLVWGYAVFGCIFATKLCESLEQVSNLTAEWARGMDLDRGYLLGKLREIQRSARAVAVITVGMAIGFIPPAFHLPGILGMIVGVGFVALNSYLDAELASRHLD